MRRAQLATLLTLLPLPRSGPSRVLELGCGTGGLSYAILEGFPECHVLALDGSDAMRERTRKHVHHFEPRVDVRPFVLDREDWRKSLDGVDAVVSSLALHHLSGEGKRELFRRAAQSLSERGAFLVADLVEPQRSEAEEVFRVTWDETAEAAGSELGAPETARRFHAEEWNIFRYPDPADTPSPLFHQLEWLREAGFAVVDCFWLYAGHAIYGGYRSSEGQSDGLSYRRANEIAAKAIAATT